MQTNYQKGKFDLPNRHTSFVDGPSKISVVLKFKGYYLLFETTAIYQISLETLPKYKKEHFFCNLSNLIQAHKKHLSQAYKLALTFFFTEKTY